jgi:hypothetical protein
MIDNRKHPKRPRDINQRAFSTVAIATGQTTEDESEATQTPEPTAEEKHTAAVMLGKKGGQARASKLTPEQRKEIARKAANRRWKSE